MKVTLQKQLEQEMRSASEVMGVSEEELTERAMRFYLASIHQELADSPGFSGKVSTH